MSTTRTTLNKRMRLIEAADLVAGIDGTAVTVKTNAPLSKLAAINNNSFPSSATIAKPSTTDASSSSPFFNCGPPVNLPFSSTMALSPKTIITTPIIPTAEDEDLDSDDFMQTGFAESSHPNTIIHLDIDCFYAQVEEIRDPSLRERPLGIQQKNCLVTCNYKARSVGVKKLMRVGEAQTLCPDLVLIKGEDLTPYRQMSSRVFEHITRKYPQLNVERLGMDENFVDVTRLIEERMDQDDDALTTVQGCIYPSSSIDFVSNCLCGCARRLAVGTHIAKDLRESLFKELGITTCAGIAHNKMLAKLAGALNKPNNQTVVVPTRCRDLMVQLKELRSIPGIGQKTESLLNEMHVDSIEALQRVDQKSLVLKFGPEMAKKLKDWSHGVDQSLVRPSNFKPKSIGLEDSCHKQPISVRQEIEDKFRALLQRLLNQVADDGRIPVAIKMTLRKFDAVKKTSHRETKQANILPTLFHFSMDQKLTIVSGGQEKVLQIIMRLFERVIDMRLPFNVTLLGLAFSKFQERKCGAASITSFLMKKKDIEVQSVTSLTSEGVSAAELPSPVAQFSGVGRFYREQRDLETMSDTMSVASDVSEPSEIVEPSPKKSRLGLSLMAKRRCFQQPQDCASPSKLRVAELRLNSVDREREAMAVEGSSTSGGGGLVVPNSVDPEVFKELPSDLQNELIRSWAEAAAVAASGGGGSGLLRGRGLGAAAGGGGADVKMNSSNSLNISTGNVGAGQGKKSIVAAAVGKGGSNKATTTLHRYFIANK